MTDATSVNDPAPARPPTYAVAGEFGDIPDIVAAARAARRAGYTRVEAYTPFPVEELSDIIVSRRSRLPIAVLAGGIAGGLTSYLFQVWIHTVHNALNVGGRPLHSWPLFVPVTFELTILAASTTAVLVMLAANGLPRFHHPVFNHPDFSLGSADRFFLTIETADPLSRRTDVRQFLRDHQAREVSDVEW